MISSYDNHSKTNKIIRNIAPLSFVAPLTSDPCTVMFSVTTKKNGIFKDTLVNIDKNKEFVINHCIESIFDKVFEASQEFPPEIDEFETVGFNFGKCVHLSGFLLFACFFLFRNFACFFCDVFCIACRQQKK